MIVITCSKKDLELTEVDDIVEFWEYVVEDVLTHGVKQSDYQTGNIIIEVEE